MRASRSSPSRPDRRPNSQTRTLSTSTLQLDNLNTCQCEHPPRSKAGAPHCAIYHYCYILGRNAIRALKTTTSAAESHSRRGDNGALPRRDSPRGATVLAGESQLEAHRVIVCLFGRKWIGRWMCVCLLARSQVSSRGTSATTTTTTTTTTTRSRHFNAIRPI